MSAEAVTEVCDDSSGQAGVIAAGGFEDGEEMGEAEKFADGGAHVDELNFDASFVGGDIETDERAEAGAIHTGETGEIESDVFFMRKHFLDVRFEKRCAFGDQRAAAIKGERVMLLFGADS